jgi:hypothetical protein
MASLKPVTERIKISGAALRAGLAAPKMLKACIGQNVVKKETDGELTPRTIINAK